VTAVEGRVLTTQFGAMLGTVYDGTTVTVHIGRAPAEPTYPHAVLYPRTPWAQRTGLNGEHAAATWACQITFVGRDPDETQGAADGAQTLVGQVPVVAGYDCGPISQPGPPPMVRPDETSRDPATGQPLFYAICEYEFTATRT
jgi:hypothetical protein